MSILQKEHKYDLSIWEEELKESKVILFEKKETEKGLQQVLTPGEKDVKDEDIKEEFFYILPMENMKSSRALQLF